MAQGSKKGACSANVQPAKANCLKHNRREGKVPSNVDPHRSHLNRTIFEDDMIKGRKSIVPLMKRAELLFTEKTGQKCQKTFVPFREDVLSLPGRGDITDEQIMSYLRLVEEKFGIKPLGAWYHQDEGYAHSKYIEGDEDYETNYHVHVLYSCQNQKDGTAIRLPRSFYTLRQDFLSKASGLERGNPAALTRKERREAAQQRIHAIEERIRKLEEEEQRRDLKSQEDVKRMEMEKDKLKREIDALGLRKAAKEKLLGALGQSSKDREIAQLKETVAGEPERTAKTVATAKAEERQKVITEICKAANYKADGQTAKKIGESWRNGWNKAQSLETEHQADAAQTEARIKREVGNYQKRAEKAEKEAKLWKDRFLDVWPAAAKAIAAIVEKVNSTWQNLFTSQQVSDIDAAMSGAADTDDRIERGRQLMEYARPEFTRDEEDTAEQVEEIALYGQNVRKIGKGIGVGS